MTIEVLDDDMEHLQRFILTKSLIYGFIFFSAIDLLTSIIGRDKEIMPIYICMMSYSIIYFIVFKAAITLILARWFYLEAVASYKNNTMFVIVLIIFLLSALVVVINLYALLIW